SGGHLKQYEISINPEKLHSFDLSLTDIFEAVSQNNSNTGGSYIEKDQYAYFIRGEGLIKGVHDIENTLVAKRGETLIRISDIAEVSIGHAPRFGAVTMNGMGEVVAGQVLMLKGENPAEVTQRVRKRMEQIQQSLPEGVIIEPYLDRTKLVDRTTRTISINLLEGGLIVIFVLVVFLGNLRAGLIVASVIPLSLLFAASMMHLTGVSANLMSLGAIDFGLIVDGAIIIVEAILFHLSMQQSPTTLSAGQINTHVFLAASKIRNSAAFGEVIILIVYLPILFLSGVEGKMFKPMAQTVSFAIMGALILSITYVPMMSSLLLGRRQILHKKTFSGKLLDTLQQAYKGTIVQILRHRWVILTVTLILFVLSVWSAKSPSSKVGMNSPPIRSSLQTLR
ncbi:MAG: efflux RND transporter permease subunit, partial [Bacteroidota bacterium]